MVKNRVLLNIAFNVVAAVAFVLLNTWALNTGLEETFVAFALAYGVVSVIGNAMFMAYAAKGR